MQRLIFVCLFLYLYLLWTQVHEINFIRLSDTVCLEPQYLFYEERREFNSMIRYASVFRYHWLSFLPRLLLLALTIGESQINVSIMRN